MKEINYIAHTSKSSPIDIAEGKRNISHRKITAQTKRSASGDNHHHISRISKVIAKTKAYLLVKGIKSALKEVDLIESGKKKPKSLDQLLNELLVTPSA